MSSQSHFSRRSFLKTSGLALSALAVGARVGVPRKSAAFSDSMSPRAEKIEASEALEMLIEGNQRYVEFHLEHPHQTEARLLEVSKGQSPFAIIVGCADSRVPPEVVFDQGLGDLFVVRIAGNIIDDAILGSVEYAAEHLRAPLVMVLGHENCGAVKATVEILETGAAAPGHIGSLVKAITPAVQAAKSAKGDVVNNAVTANVLWGMMQLKSASPILTELIHKHELMVVGGRYDLDTGEVAVMR